MNSVLRSIGIALATAAAGVFAQTATQAPSAPPAAGQCAGCHGAQGEGNSAGGFPRIAGQSQYYIAKQLEDYATGRRRNPVMEPIAMGLATGDRDTVAAYYSKISTAPPPPPAQANGNTGGRARELSVAGDGRRRVQACNNCHGPDGAGEPPVFPYIAGLDAKYLQTALTEWRNGARDNDPTKQMPMIAKALAEEDIASLAQYYATLPPPKPVVARIVNQPAQASAAKAGTSSSTPESSTAQSGASGSGVEQGAATSGGSQGPGGSGDSRSDRSRR